MNKSDMQIVRDAAWRALATSPVRRRLLGRERCDAIARVAAEHLADVVAAPLGDVSLRDHVEQRVRQHYREQAGFAFITLVIGWAISAIVQALVNQWLNSREQRK